VRIFIYCADPREEADLEEKINEQLLSEDERSGAKKIIRLSFFGGPICLAHPDHLLKNDALWLLGQVRFAVKNFPGTNNVVLIGHDCGYYDCIPLLADGAKKREDIKRGVYFLHKNIHGLVIDAYYDNKSSFEKIMGAKKAHELRPVLQK
jgi:hypothetical protein